MDASLNQNRIALFTGVRSLTGAAIQWATGCEFVHAAIQIDGVWYDASESRNDFSRMDVQQYASRRCVVFDLPMPEGAADDLKSWLARSNGKEYDWPGVLLWLFKHKGSADKFYCFEAAREAMQVCSVVVPEYPVSGCHLVAAFEALGRSGYYGRFGVLQ